MKGCKVLNKTEIRKLLSVAQDQREKMLVLTGLYFGTRISETVSLTFGQFENTDHVRIKRNKNSRDTTLKIPAVFRKELNVHKKALWRKGYNVEGNAPIFPSRKGGALRSDSACKILQKMFDRAGIKGKVGAHSFRKCFTTKIYELCGNDIVQTSAYTGHKNLTSLIGYIETTQETNLTDQLAWT
jgi:integrase